MKSIYICLLTFLLSFNFVESQNSTQENNKELELILGGNIILNSVFEKIDIIGDLDSGLFLKVNIKEKDYIFLFDTASSVSVINNNIVDKSQTSSKITTIDNFGNENDLDLYILDFKIGQNTFKDFAFVKKDLTNIKLNTCLNIDGILGINILKKLNWKLILNEKSLYFSKENFNYAGFYNPIQIKWFNNLVPLIEVFSDKSSFYVAIDTGYFGTVKLSQENYNSFENNYKQLVKGSGFPFHSIENKIKTELRKSKINGLSFKNGISLKSYEIIIDNSKPLVGNKVLFNDNLIFNFLIDEVSFGKDFNSMKKNHNDLNFKICKSEKNNNEIELCFFWQNDYTKNLKVGDKIIQIDDIKTDNISNDDYCDLLNYIKDRATLKVIFQRGKKQFISIINLNEL
jgi:hypothetical protein